MPPSNSVVAARVDNTADIGSFRIVREEAISAGVRRIQAVAGEVALELAQREMALSAQIADLLGLDSDPDPPASPSPP